MKKKLGSIIKMLETIDIAKSTLYRGDVFVTIKKDPVLGALLLNDDGVKVWLTLIPEKSYIVIA